MMQFALVKKQPLTLLLLMFLIVITAIISMGLGYSALSYSRLVPVLLGDGTFKEDFVLFSIRLPRLVITLLAGMALALSGALLQSITRNDLADPGIIGINSGAGAAVALFFLFGPVNPGSFVYLLPVAAFAGALLTAVIIYLFSLSKTDGLNPLKLVLTGVGFSMALSGLMIVLVSAAERDKVEFIAGWLSGSIWGTDWPFVWALLPWLVFLVPAAIWKANRLNILFLNDAVAIGAGISVEKERLSVLIISVALAASAVSVTGGIAFVGLIAPHIAKALVGTRHQLFLPVAILLGGWLLLLADTIGRNIAEPGGIPAGIIASFIGAPYFIFLLLKK